MSIAGYLMKSRNELRMPKSGEIPSNQAKDALSIRFEGPVLSGEKSVEDAQRANADNHDPVLRAYPPAIPGKLVLPFEPKPRPSGPGIIWRDKKR